MKLRDPGSIASKEVPFFFLFFFFKFYVSFLFDLEFKCFIYSSMLNEFIIAHLLLHIDIIDTAVILIKQHTY
jgi:hypothetical protein